MGCRGRALAQIQTKVRRGWAQKGHIVLMDQIAALLRTINADVVVLNEVDFDSTWTHSVDEARYLAEKAGYPFLAEQRNIDYRVLT